MTHKILFCVRKPAFIFKIGRHYKTSNKLAKKQACVHQKESKDIANRLHPG